MKQKKPLSHQSNLRIFAANSCTNPLREVDGKWSEFNSETGLSARIVCKQSKDLTEEEFQWISDLTELNMKDHYEKSDNGWNKKQKEKEFRHETARFLFVYPKTSPDDKVSNAMAFVHFRFELDDEQKHPVVYCYEIQVKPEFQSKGLGKHLMLVLQEIATRFKMYKVMLTCFKHNTSTMSWYHKLGYTPDVCDPEKSGENVKYHILSCRSK